MKIIEQEKRITDLKNLLAELTSRDDKGYN